MSNNCVSDITVDLGKVKKGGTAQASFKVTNVCSNDITVKKIGSSCGCTVPDKIETIPANSSVTSSVKYTKTSVVGKIEQNVYLYYKDGSKTRIKVIGEIVN